MFGNYKVESCLRCHGENILPSFPVIFCKDCGTIMSFENNGPKDGLKCVKFHTKSCQVRIMCLEDKTFINELELGVALPFDVSDEKLHTYLVFS